MIWNAVHKAACIRASGSVCLNPRRWTQDRSPYLFHFAGSRVSDAYLHYNSTFHLSKKKLSCWKSGGFAGRKEKKKRKKDDTTFAPAARAFVDPKSKWIHENPLLPYELLVIFQIRAPRNTNRTWQKYETTSPPHISFPLNTAYTHFVQGLTNLKLKACLFFRLNLKIADELSSVKQAIVSLGA